MRHLPLLLAFASACQTSVASEHTPTVAIQEKPLLIPDRAVNITSLSIAVDVAGNSEVIDNTVSAGFPSATIYTSPTIFIVGFNELFWQPDLARQKMDIQRASGNKFRKFIKEEVNENGFHIEFELSSMMDPTKTLYGFHIRSTIAGQKFDCSSNAENIVLLSKGVATCRTLRSAF